ncbi:MAG: hypothetical protein KDA67_04285 [Rhodobacteraceae bacterium]|nr:hypothetical protein [Paracoccaceae bacterium]
MTNAEKSQLVMARILEKAMEMGIQEWMLSFGELELGEDFEDFFFPCLEWLESEGFIRVQGYNRYLGGAAKGNVQNVHITSFGQSVLRREVNITGESEMLSETVKSVSREPASYSQFGDFLGSLLGGFTKSIGS